LTGGNDVPPERFRIAVQTNVIGQGETQGPRVAAFVSNIALQDL
jgi:hypothetical protein